MDVQGKVLVKVVHQGQLRPLLMRLNLMQNLVRLQTLASVIGALALTLVVTGCAVPVTDGYGYDAYDGYGPAYPAPTYVVPSGPPVVYGAPPVMFGGQIWIDGSRRQAPPYWRDRPGWRHDGPRPHEQNRWQHQRPRDHRPDVRPRPTPPEQAQRPHVPDRPSFGNGSRGNLGGPNGRDFP